MRLACAQTITPATNSCVFTFPFSGPECNYSSYISVCAHCTKKDVVWKQLLVLVGSVELFHLLVCFFIAKTGLQQSCASNDLRTCVFQDTCPQPHEASKPSGGPAVSMTINKSLGVYPSTTIVNPTIVLLQHNRGKMKATLLPASYFARIIIWWWGMPSWNEWNSKLPRTGTFPKGRRK